MSYRSCGRVLLFSFLFFLFLANVGYTSSEEVQDSSPTTEQTSQQAPSEGTTEPLTTQNSSSLSISSGSSSSSSSLPLPVVTPDPNTGASTANIPIEVPPRRKGIAPNLVLAYNSNRANGWIGAGWDIPIGYIQRNTKYGVNYSANDYVHVLNGASELVPRGDWGSNYYGAKIEGAFSKYYLNPSTGGWEVTTKDGTKYYFGTTTASRQDNTYGVFKWCLDKVQDTNGNYMTLSYWKDQGEIYLDRIDYTGNGSRSPTNYVKFYYESRTDVAPMYTSNAEVKTAYRLKTIDVMANGQRVRTYALAYGVSGNTSRTLLTNMQHFGWDATIDVSGTVTGGTVLPALESSYSNDTKAFTSDYPASGFCGLSELVLHGDFNGDGMQDVFCRSNSNFMYVKLSTGTSFGATEVWGTDPVCPHNGSGKMGVGDFNGDGKADLYCLNSENKLFIHQSTGSSFSTNLWKSGWCGTSELNEAADVNGDGKTDIWCLSNGNNLYATLAGTPKIQSDLLTFLSNGLGSTTTITYTPSSSYTNTLLPFIVQTVSSIAINDGFGSISTANYTYSGGLYDYTNREFRGFSYVKATGPAGTTTETWFKQDDIFKGLPYEQKTKDSSGNIYTRAYNTYQSTSPYTGVNFSYLSQKDDYVYDGTPTYKQASTSFTYDSYGNITRKYLWGDISITGDERDEYIEYSYDTINWLLSLPSRTYINDSSGTTKAQAWFTYDTKGNLLTKTAWLNGGTNPVITYTYDSYGNQASVKDARGNTTTIAYDSTYTYPTTITNPLGHIASTTYDLKFGKPLSQTDPNSNTTSYEYDVFGRLTKVTGPYDGASTYGTASYFYQNFGTVDQQRITTYSTEQSGTSNYIWKETYFDGLGRTIKTRQEGPDNKVIVTQTIYDQRGLISSASLPYFEGTENPRWTTFTYDPIGRVTKVTNPDATYVTTSYDKGRTTLIDTNGHKKVEEKDIYGRLIKVEEYTGTAPSLSLYATTTYQYDILGNLLKVTDAANNQTTMTYDTLSRKTSMTDPNMGAWTYSYDANGNLISQRDAKGQTITFTYDALNRVTKKDYPAGTDVIYTYDETTSTNSKGRLTKMTDAAGTAKYYYDKLGRLTKVIKTVNSVNYTIETSYDTLGRVVSIKYPDNVTVSYTYDTGGNLSQITGYATYTNYNALGQPGTRTYANGVTTTYQYYYSSNNRLYAITTNKQTQGFMNLSYSYDNTGNITGITDQIDSTRSQTFTYDDINRLTQAQSTSYGTLTYSYNQIGNIMLKEGINYTYGTKPHAVTSTSDGKTYTYDANGNMTSDSQRTITYNYENRPTSIKYNKKTTTFVYDGNGGRVKKTTSNGTTIYIGELYECVSGSCSKYIFAGDTRVALKSSTETYYYHQDHLGSSRVVTDQSGSKVEEIHYYPYGATRIDTGSISVNHKFTSQEIDNETGLYYYGARYYDPNLWEVYKCR